MIGKCCACDVKLTPAECAIECGMCQTCRAEHDAGYAANLAGERLRLLNTLRWVLYWKIVAQEMAAMGWFVTDGFSQPAPWVYTSEGEN